MARRGLSRRMVIAGGAVVVAGGGAFVAGGGQNLFYHVLTEAVAGPVLDAPSAHKKALAGEITLIDIRRPDEWEETGYGEGAVRLDMRRDDFVAALDEVIGGNRDAPVALICARGVRSARLNNRLVEAGYTNITDVPEGMLGNRHGPGWIERGLPLVRN